MHLFQQDNDAAVAALTHHSPCRSSFVHGMSLAPWNRIQIYRRIIYRSLLKSYYLPPFCRNWSWICILFIRAIFHWMMITWCRCALPVRISNKNVRYDWDGGGGIPDVFKLPIVVLLENDGLSMCTHCVQIFICRFQTSFAMSWKNPNNFKWVGNLLIGSHGTIFWTTDNDNTNIENKWIIGDVLLFFLPCKSLVDHCNARIIQATIFFNIFHGIVYFLSWFHYINH